MCVVSSKQLLLCFNLVELIRTITHQNISNSLNQCYQQINKNHNTSDSTTLFNRPPFASISSVLFTYFSMSNTGWTHTLESASLYLPLAQYVFMFRRGQNGTRTRTTGGNSGEEKYVPTTSVQFHWHFNDTSSGVHLIIRLLSTISYTG